MHPKIVPHRHCDDRENPRRRKPTNSPWINEPWPEATAGSLPCGQVDSAEARAANQGSEPGRRVIAKGTSRAVRFPPEVDSVVSALRNAGVSQRQVSSVELGDAKAGIGQLGATKPPGPVLGGSSSVTRRGTGPGGTGGPAPYAGVLP